MATQFAVVEDYGRNSAKKCILHDTELANNQARLATILIEKWGMVLAESDGEDSSGRAKLRTAAPAEVVERACKTAELAIEAFRARGWIIDGPDISELLRKTDD